MNFIITILTGFSQVFFQQNSILGILIVIGLFIASPVAAIFIILGNIVTTFVGYLIHPTKSLVETGVYGLNGALVGAAVSFYIKNLSVAFVFVIIGSIIAGLLYYLLFKNNIQPLAIPFVITTLAIIALKKYFNF